jgi:myosin heavy subunit
VPDPEWNGSSLGPPASELIRENAQLRREIKERESANAHLSDELEALREQMASLELSHSTSGSLEEVLKSKDSAIQGLRHELKGAKAVARENSRLSEENAAIHQALLAHKSKLRSAKRELARLSSIADQQSAQSHHPEPPEDSRHADKKYRRVRDENSALRAEAEYLRLKKQELSAELVRERERSQSSQFEGREFDRLRREVIHLRSAAKPPPAAARRDDIAVVAAKIRDSVQRRSANFILKIHFFESRITTELDAIDVRMGKLRTAYYQVKILQNRRVPAHARTPDAEDFLAHLGRSVRSIEALSHAYARAYDFPPRKVPAPTDLITSRGVLKRFIRTVESGARESLMYD